MLDFPNREDHCRVVYGSNSCPILRFLWDHRGRRIGSIIIHFECLVDLKEILSLPEEAMAHLINRAVSGKRGQSNNGTFDRTYSSFHSLLNSLHIPGGMGGEVSDVGN